MFDLPVGMKLTKAYAYLGDVKEHKRAIPFRRFSGGVGRASQAKEFKATQGAQLSFHLNICRVYNRTFFAGRWPEKSIKFILRLLKNAESNADAKNIDLEDLFVKNIVVQQAPVRLYREFGCKFTDSLNPQENSPPHISCPWSYQPIPRPPDACRDHP